MADQKKMSVADILAAARKADGGKAPTESAAPPAAEPAASEAASASAAPATPTTKPAAVPKPGAAGRPSVADMMAMARSAKGEAAAPAVAAKASPAAEKPAPAAKPKPAAAEKVAAAPVRDTASILAAVRKKDRPGPITKAEAAAKTELAPAAKQVLIVPPMPAKPDYALAKPAAAKKVPAEVDDERRNFLGIGFWLLGAVSALWTLATVKFMFPNVLREPPSKFKVGFPDAFPPGQVEEKFKAQFGIWVTNVEYNGQQEIVALKSVCTHLGCTPNWLEAEQKFKCPCHGSGFYKDGINFEGPAPRPLERYAIRVADDGQIEVDKSRTFQEEMGAWADPACFIPV